MRTLVAAAAIVLCLTIAFAAQSQESLPQADPPTEQPAGQPAPAAAPGAAEFRRQVSYALGRNFAHGLRENEIECDIEALLAGISDTLTNAPPKWSDEQLTPALQRFGREMQQKAEARVRQLGEKNKQAADAFLAQNAKREGVQTTPSGLQYRVIQQGNGPSPTMNDTVRCHYRGTLLDGNEFDSSARLGGPAEFRIAPGLIQGWIEALQKMHVGDKWQVFVPPHLAYEMDPPGPPIEPNSLLVFDIELVEIVP